MTDTTPTRDALLEKIVDRLFADQRSRRRWRWFWVILIGGYLAAGLAFAWDSLTTAAKPHAAVIRITGTISASSPASADRIARGLRAAAGKDTVRAIVLDIDSPGGSPVQAERVVAALKRLRAERDLPVVAVIGDTGASAAYYIAASADTIYAANASVVGSIGVLIDSFGFTDAMRQLGVERRLFTAGEHKGLLDMFSPVSETARGHIATTLAQIHQQFVAAVRAGRADKLTDTADLFSGLFWTGSEARKLGLVDQIGDRRDALHDLGLAEAIDYTPLSIADAWREGLGATLGIVGTHLRLATGGWGWQ